MSGTWYPASDGVHEWQQETDPKPDGTITYTVRKIGQSTRYPHANFDYNPQTGDFTYNHYSFSKRQKAGMREVMSTAIAYLKGKGLL
ncbi:hypothetical protein FJR11_01035 [Anabaena sp. UHCC 0187]|uniref:hypothetical protein n=1 Tax=Anabaena sp. UHCC 0187 TaxID=2590018 RepID=UPI001444C4A9|nr:hypothetical protein [Anabaena sp. UHCC 0187]MTJ11202.1 hypothetical protein [Anabaena sp. UHCC 0187]